MSLFPLVAQLQMKSRVAQEAFYNRYSPMMFLVARRYVSIDYVADEMVHEGFMNFFVSVVELEYVSDGSVIAFLKKVMVNSCLNYLKHAKRKKYQVSELAEELEEANHTTEEDVISDITAKEIFLLVSSLPEDYRIIFCMYVYDGFTHVEIGKLLNINPILSATKLTRAKKRLRELILKNYNNDGGRKSG